ncbi:hypothetical protein Pyrfu_0095 [Pyrolobus fumarii 1A]|uniref:UPF0282 protein Pyrfu_0095 n=1 Tax=Pyrolobus fumarii (strain DSM 11204 / 1A) TaxID=694429 RepID=G0EE51_PYRF1|nr:MBL fold metallo-hydrolase [Pyrolobus fumarii]AEM37967.1 hypothetical protein Pyrfu_0095 [Pyrolobus fumarii 1A]
MRISIIAADSMGVRSLATLVESAAGTRVFIDPGASFAPRRYGLPPHPCEEARLEEALSRIRSVLRDVHAAVITHYHYDHYLYRSGEEEYYRGLLLLVKHPESSINVSQRLRAHRFLRKQGVAELARVAYADGGSFEVEDVRLVFSPPVPHGRPGTPLGYVVMVLVEADGVRLVFASDVQGPGSREALEWIISTRPDVVIMSGPPTYMEGVKVPEEEVRASTSLLLELVSRLPRGSTLVLDHHTLRDASFREKLGEVYSLAGTRGVRVVTAAEFMGVPLEPLEALRRRLWEGEVSC